MHTGESTARQGAFLPSCVAVFGTLPLLLLWAAIVIVMIVVIRKAQ